MCIVLVSKLLLTAGVLCWSAFIGLGRRVRGRPDRTPVSGPLSADAPTRAYLLQSSTLQFAMERVWCFLLFLCFHSAAFSNPLLQECVIELSCAECVPDNMPLVTSHAAAAGAVRAQHGDEVLLACAGGKFLAYPLLETVSAVCEAGRYRVRHDGKLRSVLELGCQEDIFEDVLHTVEHCGAPLQGRAYQAREPGARAPRHVGVLCWDADRGLTRWARASSAPRNALRLPAHDDRSAPLTLLGNFNHMFDAKTRSEAERLYTNPAHMTRRVLESFKHERVSFAGQLLAPGRLLAPEYFEDQNTRVTDFPSNQVPTWASVSAGNLRHMQHDVARFLRQTHAHAALDVYAGTHDVQSLRTPQGRAHVYLKADRFPVPKYIWTVVHDQSTERAIAIVLLNDPFIAVSEIREAVFCESACGRVRWLKDLTRNRNYEVPLYGLIFCCSVQDFTAHVPSMPKDILKNVPPGDSGMLLDTFPKSG